MDIVSPSFKVCEEILDYFLLYSTEIITKTKLISALGKTPAYVKKSLDFLIENKIIVEDTSLILSEQYKKFINDGVSINGIIKIAITNNAVFKEYYRLKQTGKNEKQSAQYVIALKKLKIEPNHLIRILNSWSKFLNQQPKDKKAREADDKHGFMWVNEYGNLIYDEKAHTQFIVDQIEKEHKQLGEGSVYVDPDRINHLQNIKNNEFDLSKLIRKCEELNIAYSTKCFFSVGMLTRAIIDHVPPIFNKNNFAEVAGSHGSKSFRDSMVHLEKSSRKIADSFLHTHIRKKEILPTKTQVNFSSDLDVLLGEIIRILK
jgi:hypothetical protein